MRPAVNQPRNPDNDDAVRRGAAERARLADEARRDHRREWILSPGLAEAVAAMAHADRLRNDGSEGAPKTTGPTGYPIACTQLVARRRGSPVGAATTAGRPE